MSLLEMSEMRDLRGACQWELELESCSWTDPMNSDMAAKSGYQNCKKKERDREAERSRGEGRRCWGACVEVG